jgi:hypothetical protein
MTPKYYMPYEVLERVGGLTYRLLLPLRARLHNVFHVVFLKKFEGARPSSVLPLPPILHGRVVPQPEQVIRAKPMVDSWEILVRWKDRGEEKQPRSQLSNLRKLIRIFSSSMSCFTEEVSWARSLASNMRAKGRVDPRWGDQATTEGASFVVKFIQLAVFS